MKKNVFLSMGIVVSSLFLFACQSEQDEQVEALIEEGYSEEEAIYMYELANELFGDEAAPLEEEKEEVVPVVVEEEVYEVPKETKEQLEKEITTLLEDNDFSLRDLEFELGLAGFSPQDYNLVLEEMNVDWSQEMVSIAEKFASENTYSKWGIIEYLTSQGFSRDFAEEHIDKANIDYVSRAKERALEHRNKFGDSPELWLSEGMVRSELEMSKFEQEVIDEALADIEFSK